jgi:hypothetical protein
MKTKTGFVHPVPDERTYMTTTTTTTTEQTISEKGQDDGESFHDEQQVAWYARDDGEIFDADSLDTTVRIGEVYELVSVMFKHAPFDRCDPTAECIIEVTNQRAWPGFEELVLTIHEEFGLHDETRSSRRSTSATSGSRLDESDGRAPQDTSHSKPQTEQLAPSTTR